MSPAPGVANETPPNPRLFPTHSPSLIASTQKVRDVKISPDGTKILYQVTTFYKEDRVLSELWIAETDVPSSASRLTDGQFNDRGAVFYPDGSKILFLSDRLNLGKGKDIFSLALGEGLNAHINEPDLVLASSKKWSIQSFELSPNGKSIAFSSPNSVSEADTVKLKEASDARIFGEKKGLSSLCVFDINTGEIRHVEGIRSDMHVEAFTWSPDSLELLYRLRQNKGSEYTEFEVLLEKISILPGSSPTPVGIYPRSPSGRNIWLRSGHIATLQNYEPANILDARTLFVHRDDEQLASDGERLYGVSEDAVSIVNLHYVNENNPEKVGMIGVEVCSDVDTRIDAVILHPNGRTQIVPLWNTEEEAIWFGAWDARYVVDKVTGVASFVVSAVLSSGYRHEPPNVWSVRVQVGDTILCLDGQVSSEGKVAASTRNSHGTSVPSGVRHKLSSHLQWLVNAATIRTEVWRWKAQDGTELSGLVRYPPGYGGGPPLPTVLFIHGGPYRRDIPDYMPYFCNWREFLASAGYLVISPNYRGSQGRGHKFAYAASEGIGENDWNDCESMITEVINRGLADPDRLGVAGWSHGGSLTAWGVTMTKSRFKAAIVGAGVSNWEGMVLESGSPELENEIGQRSPWDCVSGRKLSPINEVSGVNTAVLILHGERDERVPVGQAIGLYRGLKRKADKRGRNAVELVLYPREPHGFVERKHAEDVMNRVLHYFNKWL